jgi:hypothetical protein
MYLIKLTNGISGGFLIIVAAWFYGTALIQLKKR